MALRHVPGTSQVPGTFASELEELRYTPYMLGRNARRMSLQEPRDSSPPDHREAWRAA